MGTLSALAWSPSIRLIVTVYTKMLPALLAHSLPPTPDRKRPRRLRLRLTLGCYPVALLRVGLVSATYPVTTRAVVPGQLGSAPCWAVAGSPST